MVTSGFQIHPVFLLPITAVLAAVGIYLIGSGACDLFDHETAELFTKDRTILISQKSNPEEFNTHVGWRMALGAGSLVLAFGLLRLRHWHQET